MKEALFGRTLEELQELVVELGLPKFNAKQIAQWHQQMLQFFLPEYYQQ